MLMNLDTNKMQKILENSILSLNLDHSLDYAINNNLNMAHAVRLLIGGKT